jgi:hypothetical protein
MFPATFMAVLAVSEQAEQAVVTSTLILWRSLGTVLGVASSSLVLQNALLYYLNEKVVGPDKDYVRISPPHFSLFLCIIFFSPLLLNRHNFELTPR